MTEQYRERQMCIDRALRHERQERTPVVYYFDFYAARRQRVPAARFVEDPALRREAVVKTFLETQADGFMIGRLPSVFSFAAGGFPNRIKVPGRELPDDVPWQFDESRETMSVEDYDRVAARGWSAFLPDLLPRFSDIDPADLPGLREEARKQGSLDAAAWREAGVPILCGAAATPPFEVLAAARTLPRFFLDLRRHPDRVLAAMEAMLPEFVEGALEDARYYAIPRIVISANRECCGMISPADFEKFALPFLHGMVDAFHREGMQVMLHLDSDWTLNLPYFKDFPPGCILHTDGSTNLLKAREILGGHCVLMGDVPASVLCLGSPAQVKEYCRRLMAGVGQQGGFILSSGCDVPMDARPENVLAIAEAARGH